MSNQSKLNGKLMPSLTEQTSFFYTQGQSIYYPVHFVKQNSGTLCNFTMDLLIYLHVAYATPHLEFIFNKDWYHSDIFIDKSHS